MWVVWLVVGASILLSAAVLLRLSPNFRTAELGWRFLSVSGILLSVGGINFIIRFWQPTSGPYLANKLYPYGDHLHAWAVSFGFASLAFGLLFSSITLWGSGDATRLFWTTLLVTWLIYWLPHLLIGLAFAFGGGYAASMEVYRKWAFRPGGLSLLLFNAGVLVAHFGLSILGFVLSGMQIGRHKLSEPRQP